LVAELTAVSKAFGERHIVRDFSMTILRGDRIGLIGPNGAGKTTLLKLILGDLAPDSGQVRLGTSLTVAYFDQFREQLDLDATLADTISPGSDWVEVGRERKHIMSYLEEFLFSPERARSPVRTLSGGERNRLLLARLFARPANVLVLDEPTNDLDIETLELLESLLQDYGGTVLLVSHDRAFLDAVVTQTIVAEGEGLWREYAGGYEDYALARSRSQALSGAADKSSERTGDKAATAGAAKPRVKLTYKETRELEALPARIAALEAEQRAITAQLSEGSVYVADAAKARALNDRHDVIDVELTQCLERWEALDARSK
jgi:ABC transport system ATP-binding/permease protein